MHAGQNLVFMIGSPLLRNYDQGMAPSDPNPVEIYPGDLTRSARMVGPWVARLQSEGLLLTHPLPGHFIRIALHRVLTLVLTP